MRQVSGIYDKFKICSRFNFGVGVKVASARTCADINGHNFGNNENVQGFLNIFVDKGLHFLAA